MSKMPPHTDDVEPGSPQPASPDNAADTPAPDSADEPTPDSADEPASVTPMLPLGPTTAAVHKSMQGNKRRDTKPEIVVRQMLRKLGYPGYRLDWKKAPGHPDIAYPGRKIAIFVHGCFWHRCPTCNLPVPKSNTEYWQAKFARNVERDEKTRAALEADGWTVAVIWEHQLKKAHLDQTERYLYEVVSLPQLEECGARNELEDEGQTS